MIHDTEKTVGIYTLGCKVNQYESEAIAESLESKGFLICDFEEKNAAYIINSCTVTGESDRKARQLIRRAIKTNPSAFILVCGCYSQNSPNDIAKINGVDYICGTSNKMTVVDRLEEFFDSEKKPDCAIINVPSLKDAEFEKMKIKKFERTRAYIKIQDGCESHCAYCAIPKARGPVRSKPFSDVIEEIKMLACSGCKEVVLTGIETGDYGRDISKDVNLASLLCEADKIEGIERIRLGSLDPAIIKPDFINKIKDLKTLAHHFHISLQSGSSKVLANMKRKYNRDQALRAIALLREAFPDVQLTTDVIVGFPGEDETDFKDTLDFAREARFLMIHVFPYSKREGTVAAKMKDQVDEQIKKQRVYELSRVESEIRKDILNSLTGNITTALFETYKDGYAYGHTPEFVEVKINSDCDLHGEIRKLKIISNDGNICLCECI